jgi:hypothetical protein
MNRTTLIAALNSAGITANQWTSDPNLISISLESDGNQYVNFLDQLLYFDTRAGYEMLKVKYYAYSQVSSEFIDYEKLSSATFKVRPDKHGKYGKKYSSHLKMFRNPKVGDIVYTVDSSNDYIEGRTITSFDGSTMVLNSDINVSGRTLCYASGDVLQLSGGSITTVKLGEYIESVFDDDKILIYKKPRTQYNADIYIATTSIESLVFRRFGTKQDFLRV